MTWSANTLDRKKEVRESSGTSVHGYAYRRTTDGNFISPHELFMPQIQYVDISICLNV